MADKKRKAKFKVGQVVVMLVPRTFPPRLATRFPREFLQKLTVVIGVRHPAGEYWPWVKVADGHEYYENALRPLTRRERGGK